MKRNEVENLTAAKLTFCVSNMELRSTKLSHIYIHINEYVAVDATANHFSTVAKCLHLELSRLKINMQRFDSLPNHQEH